MFKSLKVLKVGAPQAPKIYLLNPSRYLSRESVRRVVGAVRRSPRASMSHWRAYGWSPRVREVPGVSPGARLTLGRPGVMDSALEGLEGVELFLSQDASQ